VEYIIDDTRRNGLDRREPDRKTGNDRRAVIQEHAKYIAIIRKIPLFKGLHLAQFTKILRICRMVRYGANEVVIHSGTESREMFILLQGELKVVFDDGRELSRIRPVQTVGEMGIFTGENRSASVVTTANSILFAIHRKELVDLFRKDSDLGILILTNVIRDISGKLKNSNTLIEELKKAPKSG
jgi:CRP-like cAMP-binding protein